MYIPVRRFTYSPMPLSLAAWWKYADVTARRTQSQSEPHEMCSSLLLFMMSSSCARTYHPQLIPSSCSVCVCVCVYTSLALRMAFT